MPIRFDIGPGETNASFIYANRRAARRQTEAERDAVFRKYRMLVGTVYSNSWQARLAALKELSDPAVHPEYWDEDMRPRLPLNISSSMLSAIVPSAGGAFLHFRSNPGKAYYYPCAGTTAATAKRVEDLVTSPDLEKAYAGWWARMNGGRRR